MKKNYPLSSETKVTKGLKPISFILSTLSYLATIWQKLDNWWKIVNERWFIEKPKNKRENDD